MIISDLICDREVDSVILSAEVRPKSRPGFKVWFKFPKEVGSLPLTGDPFLAGFLIPCMYYGEDLRIEAPVSPLLLTSEKQIQDLICAWYSDFNRISVSAASSFESMPEIPGAEIGTFFSGGIDSTYTLLKHNYDITHLILIHGFENPIGSEGLLAVTKKALLPTIETFGRKLLIVRTNLRSRADPFTFLPGRDYDRSFFGFCYQGSILAAVGLCLQPKFHRIFIPASYPFAELEPYGSHPALDPLWSTEKLKFVHDGNEASRFQKIKKIADQVPAAAQRLQVCESNLPQEVNCCRCEKCLRTMLALSLCGALQDSLSFHHSLSLRPVRKLPYPRRWKNDYLELLEVALRLPDPQIAAALENIIKKSPVLPTTSRTPFRVLKNKAKIILPRRIRNILRSRRLRKW